MVPLEIQEVLATYGEGSGGHQRPPVGLDQRPGRGPRGEKPPDAHGISVFSLNFGIKLIQIVKFLVQFCTVKLKEFPIKGL